MKYIHVSTMQDRNGWTHGITYNIGRNKQKRIARAGKPRKHWPFLSNR